MTDTLTEAMKLLGITRVVAKPLAKQVSADMGARFADEEVWFGPDGDVIGMYTPAEGLAMLRRLVEVVDREHQDAHS